jgi:plasmid stabilization system protein ParE
MKLRYTRRAQRHLEAIAEYIAERNPDAARRVGERIRETTALLRDFQYIGREGVLAGTASWSYRLFPMSLSIASRSLQGRPPWSFSVFITERSGGQDKRSARFIP